MAKEDFCFTYYDGDAARDKAHMNRLQRGAYDDIISAQRKIGHLSLEDIKMVLSHDFDACFPALNPWVLKTDESGLFFIEWVDASLERAAAHSKKQTQNGSKGGRPKTQMKPNNNPDETQHITQTITQKNPLEYGDEYGLGIENNKDTKKKFNNKPGENENIWELTDPQIANTIELVHRTKQEKLTVDRVRDLWAGFRIQNFTGENFYKSEAAVIQHFYNTLKQPNGTHQRSAINGKSGDQRTGAEILIDRIRQQIPGGGS